MLAKAISLRWGDARLIAGPLGGDSGATRDMRKRWRYNAEDAEVGGHGSGH